LSKASRIGSIVYQELPLHRKKHVLYRKMTGEAMTWLKYQWAENDIIAYLVKHFVQQPVTIPSGNSISLLPSYRRKTRRIKLDRRQQPFEERIPNRKLLFAVNYYQRLHQQLRRKVNKEMSCSRKQFELFTKAGGPFF
jgi:hypothetical protein